jgi:hypothetical protein
MVWQIAFNVVGHTGYEFYPSWLLDSWLGRFLNTPTNHIQHHESFRGNFSLYFNLWDRLMGTNHPEYAARFREVTTRPALSAGESGPSGRLRGLPDRGRAQTQPAMNNPAVRTGFRFGNVRIMRPAEGDGNGVGIG